MLLSGLFSHWESAGFFSPECRVLRHHQARKRCVQTSQRISRVKRSRMLQPPMLREDGWSR